MNGLSTRESYNFAPSPAESQRQVAAIRLHNAAEDLLAAAKEAAERLEAFVAIDPGGANTGALTLLRAAIAEAEGRA